MLNLIQLDSFTSGNEKQEEGGRRDTQSARSLGGLNPKKQNTRLTYHLVGNDSARIHIFEKNSVSTEEKTTIS